MIVLDTDHFSVLVDRMHSQHAGLIARIEESAEPLFATTTITIIEQWQGWLAVIHGTQNLDGQLLGYSRLTTFLDVLRRWQVPPFDESAAEEFRGLRKQRIRIGTQDLKIASITLVHEALLLTANTRDFQRVPGLRAETGFDKLVDPRTSTRIQNLLEVLPRSQGRLGVKRDLDQLRDRRFDLLVIGGGITGAGAALDASARGLSVALVDKGDFAGGTSSASSKLIHGGLRYLEHGAFKLVREALHERRRLLSNAPHLVRPLRFIVPVYHDSRAPRWKLRMGLTAYDLLAGSANLARSGPLGARHIGREIPQLRTKGLVGGADYFDAQMDDARLCLDVVQTAATLGACAANYVEVIGFERSAERITAARARDRVTGDGLTIRGRQVLNAAGPWVDQVCRLAGARSTSPSPSHLKPSKGVHLILPDLGLPAALLLFHPRDGRVFFVIPWLRRTLVGTTDTFSEESPDLLAVTSDDVRYLLEGYNHFFDSAHDESAVINTFVGLRPLLAGRSGEPSAVSREFALIHSPGGLLSVAGGKYTTYRHMAEVIVDEVERLLGRRSQRSGRTGELRLDGAPTGDWPAYRERAVQGLGSSFGLAADTAGHLVDRYGRRATDVAEYLRKDAELARPILAGEPDIEAEVAYQRDHEMALFAADHLRRRTRLGLFHPGFTLCGIEGPSARSSLVTHSG